MEEGRNSSIIYKGDEHTAGCVSHQQQEKDVFPSSEDICFSPFSGGHLLRQFLFRKQSGVSNTPGTLDGGSCVNKS